MSEECKIKRALISVSDKTGVVDLAQRLAEAGVEVVSTGGTLKQLREAGVQVVSVSAFTGAPEMLDGRVKTLHPKVHAGILYRRDNPDDVQQMAAADFKAIDLVVVNLYPFQQTVARPDASDSEIVENIDVGGPSMIRAAAKNHPSVTVITCPADYDRLLSEMAEHEGATSLEFRRSCAARAFDLTAEYDGAISRYFCKGRGDTATGDELRPVYSFLRQLRYGENPHQRASLYCLEGSSAPSLVNAEVLSGKELSYNNYNDLETCLDMLLEFTEPMACVLKHANPCGAAVADNIAEAYRRAYESDPLSAFGSIIGLNREVDTECARLLHESPFIECIMAPGYSDDALKLLKKKKSRRLLVLPAMVEGRGKEQNVYRYIQGGLLLQSADEIDLDERQMKTVTGREPTKQELADLRFAWRVVKHTKSNAIVLAHDGATVGIGMGQTSRVDSAFMAVKRAGERAAGAVMASDAFFPFADGLEVGTNAGVTAIIQPGGSKGDEQVIAAADKAGAAMIFTGIRHFKH